MCERPTYFVVDMSRQDSKRPDADSSARVDTETP